MPVATRRRQRIHGTPYRPLGVGFPTTATHPTAMRLVLADAIATSHRTALLQIPIAHRLY
jgi:hypothetical protein